MSENYQAYTAAFAAHSHLVCYAVKANSNLAVLNLFARLGSGFDIVSGGELQRVIAAGGDPRKTVFSGVGKSAAEIRFALEQDILCFNVESAAELDRIEKLARELNKPAPISFRVNPDVDAQTHPYISTGLKENKFGIAYQEAEGLYSKAADSLHLKLVGIDFHIGSQILDSAPIVEACGKILQLVDRLAAQGIVLEHFDVGGGLGIPYREDEKSVDLATYSQAILGILQGRSQRLLFEPGRYLVGNAGVLLTRVEYLKQNDSIHFAVVDAAMNDLLRPALYDAYHEIKTVRIRPGAGYCYQIVGPVCESADFLARDRELNVVEQDLLAILSAGAYGMAMSSNYNTRPRACEVMVDRQSMIMIRAREAMNDLFTHESILPN